MDPAFRTNPFLSLWLSSANAWAGALRGFWTAELQRQQVAFLTQAARQATLFWTGSLPRTPARNETAAPPAPLPAERPSPAPLPVEVPSSAPLAALRVIESQPGTPPEAGPELKAPAPAPSALAAAATAAAAADDAPPSEPATPPAPETKPTGGRALASRAERRSTRHSPGKRRPH